MKFSDTEPLENKWTYKEMIVIFIMRLGKVVKFVGFAFLTGVVLRVLWRIVQLWWLESCIGALTLFIAWLGIVNQAEPPRPSSKASKPPRPPRRRFSVMSGASAHTLRDAQNRRFLLLDSPIHTTRTTRRRGERPDRPETTNS